MLDVKSGEIVKNAVIVIEKDRIKTVGGTEIPQEAQTIDLGDMTLLPGLIDMHTHLSLDFDSPEAFYQVVKEGAADFALRGARNARKTLLAGFTTVRDVGSAYFADVALMRAIDTDLIEGPRIVSAGNALGITGGHSDATGSAPSRR